MLLKAALFVALVGLSALSGTDAFARKLYTKSVPDVAASASHADLGEPLILNKYMHDPELVKQVSKVDSIGNFTSYAGFLTANATTDNNLFIWYFPAQNGDKNAPLLIWLQGGPGGASTFGLFSEIGPFYLDESMNLLPRDTTWNDEFSLLFIDNPVGAGYSYTSTNNYAKDSRNDVARDMYNVLVGFYTAFPDQLSAPLYITGESYAGHYIPSIGAYIHNANANSGTTMKMPLAGVSIGDGWTDPVNQIMAIPDLMYNLGLADENQRTQLQIYSNQTAAAINAGDYKTAFDIWDMMLNGDVYPYPTYFFNLTGSRNYDNFLRCDDPPSFGYYAQYITQPAVRTAIHVGNATLQSGLTCEMNLLNDVMNSYKNELALLMDNYKVLIYNGQLDLIVGVPLTERYLPTVQWKGQAQYIAADRTIWKVDPSDVEVAGFVRTVGTFNQIVVRGAGHIAPYDQGRACKDMIQRFVKNIPFTD